MPCLSAHIRFHRVSPSLGLTKRHAPKYPPPHRTERGHHRGTHCQPETNHTRNERLNFQGGAWVSLSPWWVIGGGCLSPKPQAPPPHQNLAGASDGVRGDGDGGVACGGDGDGAGGSGGAGRAREDEDHGGGEPQAAAPVRRGQPQWEGLQAWGDVACLSLLVCACEWVCMCEFD